MDEAINGLRAVQNGIRNEILPRFPPPRGSQFSTTQRSLLAPEDEFDRQSIKGWFFYYLFLPIALIRDWLVRRFYNDVVAPLIDEYVLRSLACRILGSDIVGLTVMCVTPHPIRDGEMVGVVPRAYCPPDIYERICKQCASAVSNAASSIRRVLHSFDSPVAVDAAELLERAMRDEKETAELLVHTSYFSTEGIAQLLADNISGGFELPTHEAISPVSNIDHSRSAEGSQKLKWPTLAGCLAFLARVSLKVGLIALPAAGFANHGVDASL